MLQTLQMLQQLFDVQLHNDGLTNNTFHSTGETRRINHYIDCNSKNVIYMVQCNRFKENRRTVDKQTINISKPTAASEHVLSNDHTATDMQLIPRELVKSNRDSAQKARKAYLIEKGQTLEPLGLNRRDGTLHIFFFFTYIYYSVVLHVFQIFHCFVISR